MLSNQTLENLRSQDSKVSKESVLWSVNLKLTHLDWTPEATLVHFQGHYLNICELDYKILHGEIQRTAKTKGEVDIGEFCLIEDVTSASWFRGRVQGRTKDLFEVYLIDHGNILTVDATYTPPVSSDLFNLPPKVVCGFFANVILLHNCPHLLVDKYFSCLIGQSITGYVQARLPYEVLVLEVPEVNSDLVLHGFGRLVDRDTFLILVELLTEVTVKRSMESGIDTPFDQSKELELFSKPSFWTKYKDVLKCAESKLICGTRAKVQLTAALYPRVFFFQMVGVERELCKISEKLALMCEYANERQRGGSTEKISLLCSAKGKDGNWYRGFLSFFPVSSHVKVLFVDYGFFETVSVDNIQRLPKEFLLTPIMAFPCLLSMNGQGKVPKSQLLNLLKSSLQGGVLDVEISGFDDEHHLYYLTVCGVEDDPVKEPEPFQMAPLTKAELLSEGNQLPTQQGLMSQELFLRKLLKEAIEAEGLQTDSVFEGFVIVAQNPNNFWIRTHKRNDEFNEMMAGIGDYFHQVKLNEEVLLNAELGDLCCAMYEKDMHFYRAVVTDKLAHGAEVFFIDFGNIEKVPTMLIKNIPKAFAKIPGFAIHCTLANLILCDDVWANAVCEFFRQAVFNKSLQVHVVQKDKNQLAVNLNVMERGKSLSIAELLVTSNKAEYISLKSVVQSDANETKNVKYSQKRATTDISRTTKQMKERSNKNDKKAPVARTFKALEIKPGWMFTVTCFSFISVKDFWCQSLDKASELKVLNDKIHQYYSAHTVALQAEDSCCVAKSPVDNKWYRGLITEKENSFASVLLVDYGYTIQVDQQQIQAILPEFVHLERQAFRCCLHNPQTSDGIKDLCDWSPVMCKFKNIVRNHTDGMQCLVVSQLDNENQGLYYVVDLHDSQTQQSLINSLINQGIKTHETANEQSDMSPESFVFSSYDLRPGMEEKVFVTHVSNQWEVYCHLERNADIIHKLEENISELCHELDNDNTRTVVQTLCLAKYLDGNWYRAVLQNNPSPFHVTVVYVDYGNTHVLEKSKVMSIPKGCADLLCTPMQALRFHLDLVPKGKRCANVEDWLKKAVLNKSARAIIVGLNQSGSCNVELFCEERSVNEKVKELIHNEEKETFSSVSVHVDTTNKKAQTREKASKKPIPLKSERKKLKAKRVNKQPQTCKNKTVSPAALMPHKTLRAGFRAKCFVSHFDSTNSFFLQLSDDEPAILKMGEDLNSLTFRHSLTKVRSLCVGDLVLAQYEEDGAIYRAEVKDYKNTFSCVKFVDYGNSALVKNGEIYPVPKQFLSLPRFSISCSLLDTCTKSDFLTDSKVQKPLLVEFVRQSKCTWKVKVQILRDDAAEDALPEKKESPTCLVETNESVRPSKKNSIKDICENQTRLKSSKTEGTNVKVTNDHAKAFTPTFIQMKAKEQVIVLSIVGVGRFYARLKRTNNILTSLEHRIAHKWCEHKTLTSKDIEKGLECLVQVHENLCHRAVVQQTFGEKSKVFLLDHGITMDISTSSIRQQHCNYLKSIPNFAVLCEINCLEFNKRGDAQRLWQETFKVATGKEVELVFLKYNEVAQLWMVEMIMDQLFLINGDEASVSLNDEMKLSIENAEKERIFEPHALLKPLFSPSENKSYMGYVTAVTSPFDFNIVVNDSSLASKKVPIMVDGSLEGKCLSQDTLELNSNDVDRKTFPYKEDSSYNKPLFKENQPLNVYPCLIWGVKPVGGTNEWSDEAIEFSRQYLYWKHLQIFFRECLLDKRWGVDILVNGSHVAKKLVDAGHAEYSDVLLELRFLEPLEVRHPECNADEDRYENKKVSDQQQ